MVPPATIYVIDDDDAVRRSLARLLKSAGYLVATFADTEGLLATEDFPSRACVITDLRLADGSGLCLPARLRERQLLLPVIIVTADDSEAMRGRALEAGAAGFFRKPLDAQALIDSIEWALRHTAVIGS